MRLLKKLFNSTCMYLVLLFTVIISLFPFLWILMSAFKTNGQILTSPFSLPTSLDFSPFIRTFSQYNFLKYTFNSLFIAGFSTIGALFIFSLAAYVFAKYDFIGKKILFLLFTITMLVPGMSRVQPIFSIILKLHLYDTKWALILVYLSSGLAVSLFILTAGFKTTPKAMSEAASIDGASFWQIFWVVNLPLVQSAITTAGVLLFLGNYNEYFYASLLTISKAHRTLPLALAFFTESFSYNYTELFAAMVIVIIPGILVYTFAQETIQQSFASSGVKE